MGMASRAYNSVSTTVLRVITNCLPLVILARLVNRQSEWYNCQQSENCIY
jgi:hypothetical protein